MLWLRPLLSLGLAAMLFCLADRLAYPQAVPQWACTDSESPCKSVSIVHDSWHAAIVLRKSDLVERTMPELADFPAAQFIEFSWGDKDYFPDPQSGIFGAIKAALWSSWQRAFTWSDSRTQSNISTAAQSSRNCA